MLYLSPTLQPHKVPDDGLDPVVPIRSAPALTTIQTLKDWEKQQVVKAAQGP
jgi:hypothetical protein